MENGRGNGAWNGAGNGAWNGAGKGLPNGNSHTSTASTGTDSLSGSKSGSQRVIEAGEVAGDYSLDWKGKGGTGSNLTRLTQPCSAVGVKKKKLYTYMYSTVTSEKDYNDGFNVAKGPVGEAIFVRCECIIAPPQQTLTPFLGRITGASAEHGSRLAFVERDNEPD